MWSCILSISRHISNLRCKKKYWLKIIWRDFSITYMHVHVCKDNLKHHFIIAVIPLPYILTSHRTAAKWKWQWLTIIERIKWLPKCRDLQTSINWTTNPLNNLILCIQLWGKFTTKSTWTVDNKCILQYNSPPSTCISQVEWSV